MSDNPYAPPATRVVDANAQESLLAAPKLIAVTLMQVLAALLAAALLVSAGRSVYEVLGSAGSSYEMIRWIVSRALLAALLVGLVVLLQKRTNAGRFLALLPLLAVVLASIQVAFKDPRAGSAPVSYYLGHYGGLTLFIGVSLWWAYHLAFSPEARRYFR